ncbi:hypothetical protein K438DRAFT_1753803 [Mycena galopus ATCC 62051]|nr:hypothetical protein K438DRAFT_1753803 [Mycena galopus ATCC 62051]
MAIKRQAGCRHLWQTEIHVYSLGNSVHSWGAFYPLLPDSDSTPGKACLRRPGKQKKNRLHPRFRKPWSPGLASLSNGFATQRLVSYRSEAGWRIGLLKEVSARRKKLTTDSKGIGDRKWAKADDHWLESESVTECDLWLAQKKPSSSKAPIREYAPHCGGRRYASACFASHSSESPLALRREDPALVWRLTLGVSPRCKDDPNLASQSTSIVMRHSGTLFQSKESEGAKTSSNDGVALFDAVEHRGIGPCGYRETGVNRTTSAGPRESQTGAAVAIMPLLSHDGGSNGDRERKVFCEWAERGRERRAGRPPPALYARPTHGRRLVYTRRRENGTLVRAKGTVRSARSLREGVHGCTLRVVAYTTTSTDANRGRPPSIAQRSHTRYCDRPREVRESGASLMPPAEEFSLFAVLLGGVMAESGVCFWGYELLVETSVILYRNSHLCWVFFPASLISNYSPAPQILLQLSRTEALTLLSRLDSRRESDACCDGGAGCVGFGWGVFLVVLGWEWGGADIEASRSGQSDGLEKELPTAHPYDVPPSRVLCMDLSQSGAARGRLEQEEAARMAKKALARPRGHPVMTALHAHRRKSWWWCRLVGQSTATAAHVASSEHDSFRILFLIFGLLSHFSRAWAWASGATHPSPILSSVRRRGTLVWCQGTGAGLESVLYRVPVTWRVQRAEAARFGARDTSFERAFSSGLAWALARNFRLKTEDEAAAAEDVRAQIPRGGRRSHRTTLYAMNGVLDGASICQALLLPRADRPSAGSSSSRLACARGRARCFDGFRRSSGLCRAFLNIGAQMYLPQQPPPPTVEDFFLPRVDKVPPKNEDFFAISKFGRTEALPHSLPLF